MFAEKGVEGTKVKTWVVGDKQEDHWGGVGEIPFGEGIECWFSDEWKHTVEKKKSGGGCTWVAQLVKHLILAQISQFVGLGPTLGSVLRAQSLEPLQILCLPLFLPLSCLCSLSLSKINKH